MGVVNKIDSPLPPKDRVYFSIVLSLYDPRGVIPQTSLVLLSTFYDVKSLIKPKRNKRKQKNKNFHYELK